MTAPVLIAEHLGKWRGSGDARLFVEVDRLELREGARLSVVGPSGCGKSTVLAMIGLALGPDSVAGFRLVAGGRTVDAAALWQRRRQAELDRLRAAVFGIIPQRGGMVPFLTLRENVALALRATGRAPDGPIEGLAETLGIADRLDHLPSAVSVGERQRAAILRALVHRPAILLADEPTSALDTGNAELILDLLVAAAQEYGCTLIVASHDVPRLDARDFVKLPHSSIALDGAARSVFAGVRADHVACAP